MISENRISRSALISILVLILVLAAIFTRHVTSDSTLLSSEQKLAQLLGSIESGDVKEWKSSTTHAMRYRVLFKALVMGTELALGGDVSDNTFYWIFVVWCFLITLASLLTFYWLLTILHFSHRYRLLGGLLFLFSFPILFAYNYPIFTKEDTLAFFWVVLALIFVIRKKLAVASLISVLAVLTRETTLIIPLSLWIASDSKPRRKILYVLPPILAFLAVRLIMGWESYDMAAGFYRNLKLPAESTVFLFLTFGAFWLTAYLGWRRNRTLPDKDYGRWVLMKSFPWVVVSVLFAAVSFSVLRENRVSFILFPWIITMSLYWIKEHSADLVRTARKKRLIYPVAILALAAIGTSTALLGFSEVIVETNAYKSLAGSFLGSHTNLATVFDTYPDVLFWSLLLIVHIALLGIIAYSSATARK